MNDSFYIESHSLHYADMQKFLADFSTPLRTGYAPVDDFGNVATERDFSRLWYSLNS